VWWGLRASADGAAPGYPVMVFGGRHADVPIGAEMGAALGRLIAGQALASIVDLSELGSSAARRRFMAAFAEALYETNEEPCTWCWTRPICGRRSDRSKAGKASWGTSRKSCAADDRAVIPGRCRSSAGRSPSRRAPPACRRVRRRGCQLNGRATRELDSACRADPRGESEPEATPKNAMPPIHRKAAQEIRALWNWFREQMKHGKNKDHRVSRVHEPRKRARSA
jgi:hypothetical protein